MRFSGLTSRLSWILLLSLTVLIGVRGDVVLRFHEFSEARSMIVETMNGTATSGSEYDIISLENFIRNYRHGPNNDQYLFFNHDLIAAYVGPPPKDHPDYQDFEKSYGTIRTWAMFDSKTLKYCDLNGIYDWGQLALFSCPNEGLYRAYAIEAVITNGVPPGVYRTEMSSGKKFMSWTSKTERDPFDMIAGDHPSIQIFQLPQQTDRVVDPQLRVAALATWQVGNVYVYKDPLKGPQKLSPFPMARSDPVLVKESYNCYYWMYHLKEIVREGYDVHDLVHTVRAPNTDEAEPWSAFIKLELSIWIAEPSAVGYEETLEMSNLIKVSEYSKVITKRFSKSGLSPCLRKAHSAVEIVKEIVYIPEVDAVGHMHETPHWKAIIKIHTDRLISTLSDIMFTISSRQNTASFHCFVGDTRVFLRLREFEFVRMGLLQPEHIKLSVSNLHKTFVHEFKFGVINVYGHGVHHIGYKWSKKYQPSSQRSDMMIIANPCIAQEFAFSVGGSMYIAEDFLRKGTQDAKKIVLPYLPLSKTPYNGTAPPDSRDFLRIFDAAFTPTHVAFLMKDSYIVLHPSSPKSKGLAEISRTQKFRLDAFVKRRWCPRTVSHKLSAQMLPVFGEEGHIIILQIFPTEGNVPMWIKPPSSSCLREADGFVKKVEDQVGTINETDIHYEEYAKVVRTNHRTGLVEPPAPPRPTPPPPPPRDIFEETDFILDSSRNFVMEGEDPHFPHELIDPASHGLENNLWDYNQANIYFLNDETGLKKLMTENGLTLSSTLAEVRIAAVEFTAAEKQFVLGLMFESSEITKAFQQSLSSPPFQALISTMTVTNYPYRVKITADESSDDPATIVDERLNTLIPFPGGVFVRNNHYRVQVIDSRDPKEIDEHKVQLNGQTQVNFVPEIYTLGTAIPSYVINLGNVIVYSSIENRYARPLHYYSWDILDVAQKTAKNLKAQDPKPLTFSDSSINFGVNNSLYDVVVTEHGFISVLRRKVRRHLVQDDEVCGVTPDTETQKVVMGSVIPLEPLREIKPFFRNDNIFQRATPDGEIVYGVYDVKPRSSFKSCPLYLDRNETARDMEACVEQMNVTLLNRPIPVCTLETHGIDMPCRDPGYLDSCTNIPFQSASCIRENDGCRASSTRHSEKDTYERPNITDPSKCDKVMDGVLTECLPKHAPREDIRTVHILGTSYHSYLQGSLQEVKSIHPESLPWEGEVRRQEPHICPFASFNLYHNRLDFAEVGYETRVTGELSYFGTGIPTEADLLVEFERNIGVVVEVSSSLEEERHLTTIRKTLDIKFEMTDYILKQLHDVNPAEKHHIRQNDFDFEDVRAREPFTVFSITFRPSIVNTLCKNSDFFRTIQFNVGCNSFSKLRLISEATPLKRINWTEYLDDYGLKWKRDEKNWKLHLPKQHIYYQQIRKKVFSCNDVTDYCEIPFYHLFKNEIYTISYRDPLLPKFEEFLTVSSRRVTGNVVLYDMLGSDEFEWTVSKLDAGCYNTEHFWYDKLLQGTKHIHNDTFEHENLYLYYKDCFSRDESQGEREMSQNLYVSPFIFFNKTNKNTIKFLRKRNQIFIFRAVLINTYYNRFTYCKNLDTFFMVRVTGIPIPRQGLDLWLYVTIFLFVFIALIITYIFFSKFYSGISTSI